MRQSHNDKGPSKRYNDFFFSENAGRSKKRGSTPSNHIETQADMSNGALCIKNESTKNGDTKCAKKGKSTK